MPTDKKLEAYLSRLEKSLGPIPVSDRAEIVTEIKSHVLDSQARNGGETDEALTALGEPETVANRYLMERGLKPVKPSRSPIIKWLTIGFLGTFGISVLAVLLVIWKFTPLIKVDEANDRVILLGGLIDVDGKAGNFQFGSSSIRHDKHLGIVEGKTTLKKDSRVRVELGNGRAQFVTSSSDQHRFRCRAEGPDRENLGRSNFVSNNSGEWVLDLSGLSKMDCEFEIPAERSIVVHSKNGLVRFEKPKFGIDASLDNGRIEFEPEARSAYRYEVRVGNGHADHFESDPRPTALVVALKVKNGQVLKANR